MRLATVRADGTTALAAMTDAGVIDLSGALADHGGLDSVDAAWIAQIGSLRNPVSGSAMPLTAGHRSAPVG